MGAGVFRLPSRGRTRLGVVTSLTVLTLGAGLTQVMPAFGAANVDNNIENYALYAYAHIDLKGSNGGAASDIVGNIGVRDADSDHSDSSPSFGACRSGSHAIKVADGYQVVADTIKSSVNCDVDDVFVNTLDTPLTIRGDQQTWTPPLALVIPDPGVFVCNASNASTVEKNTTVNVPPGTYGDADWKDDSTVNLDNGVYIFCDVNIGKDVTVTTKPGTDIRIIKSFSVNNGSTFGTACSARVFVRGTDVGGNDNTIGFGRNNVMYGTFMAPNGEIALGHTSDLHGRYWGLGMHDDFDMEVALCTPDNTTTTTSTVPQTTVPQTTVPQTTVPQTTIPDTTTVPETTSTTIADRTTTIPDSTTVVTRGTTATTATTTTVPGTVTTLENTTTTIARSLPVTGSDGWGPLLGLASLAMGRLLLLFARRRTARTA